MDAEKPPTAVSTEWGLNASQQLEAVSYMLEKATRDLQELIKQLRAAAQADDKDGPT